MESDFIMIKTNIPTKENGRCKTITEMKIWIPTEFKFVRPRRLNAIFEFETRNLARRHHFLLFATPHQESYSGESVRNKKPNKT